jgi:hypothetical protein
MAEQEVRHPYRGITTISRKESLPRPVHMHVALIDLQTPGIRFKLSSPGGSRETVRQRTVDYLETEQAQLAINAHFFLPYPSVEADAYVTGLAVSEGTLYSPFEGQPVAPDFVNQSYAILPFAPALNIDPANRVSMIYRGACQEAEDPARGESKEQLVLWNTVSGSAQIVTHGQKTIPDYSGWPNGLNALSLYSNTFSWYEVPRARTAIGVTTDDRSLVLFTVDEAAGSLGLSVSEVADFLIRDYQVRDALNLDGGGSTSMAMADPFTRRGYLLNASSDSLHGRAVGSNLAVFGRQRSGQLDLYCLGSGASARFVLSWPADAESWQLEWSSQNHPNQWMPVTQRPKIQNGRHTVIQPPYSPGRYYRLTAAR